MDGVEVLKEAVEQAFLNYRRGLATLLIKTLTELAAADPKSTYSFTSGMGIWYFTRKGLVTEDGETFEQENDDFEPEPAYSAIQDAESEYGNYAVPGGDFQIKGKKIFINELS
jgi:hypothetical protein